jgi:hypothetical protein
MPWPAWLLLSSPLKIGLWVSNRVATGTSLYFSRRRVRGRRAFWVWCLLLNGASLVALAALFWWLHRQGHD